MRFSLNNSPHSLSSSSVSQSIIRQKKSRMRSKNHHYYSQDLLATDDSRNFEAYQILPSDSEVRRKYEREVMEGKFQEFLASKNRSAAAIVKTQPLQQETYEQHLLDPELSDIPLDSQAQKTV